MQPKVGTSRAGEIRFTFNLTQYRCLLGLRASIPGIFLRRGDAELPRHVRRDVGADVAAPLAVRGRRSAPQRLAGTFTHHPERIEAAFPLFSHPGDVSGPSTGQRGLLRIGPALPGGAAGGTYSAPRGDQAGR